VKPETPPVPEYGVLLLGAVLCLVAVCVCLLQSFFTN
jgi:hypothetical protein